jgi:hypothetical protein
MRDPMSGNKGHHLLGSRIFREHFTTAFRQHPLQTRTSDGKIVFLRDSNETNGVFVKAADLGITPEIINIIIVGSGDQFRNTGGSTGKE